MKTSVKPENGTRHQATEKPENGGRRYDRQRSGKGQEDLDNNVTGKRICKKCLIREMADQEDLYKTLRRLIDELEPNERAAEEVIEKRLKICTECELLLEGMCRACGCYVELRAATAEQECPYEKW